MKKYVKPELFYENFELSQHIADCAWEMHYTLEGGCHADGDSSKLPGFKDLFTVAARCSLNETTYEDYCYTTGSAGANVFIS